MNYAKCIHLCTSMAVSQRHSMTQKGMLPCNFIQQQSLYKHVTCNTIYILQLLLVNQLPADVWTVNIQLQTSRNEQICQSRGGNGHLI